MAKSDPQKKFDKKKAQAIKSLDKEFDKYKNTNRDLEYTYILSSFIELMSQRKHELFQISDINNPGGILKNAFINIVISDYDGLTRKGKYKNNILKNFLSNEYIELQKDHKQRYETGNLTKEYNYKPDFLSASNDQIIEILALNKSYDDYIAKLNDELRKLQAIKLNNIPERKTISPIKWLGSGKNLAELFIELKEKGWIEKFDYKTIITCFTQTGSINIYLKPGEKNEKNTYSRLYSPKYKRKFNEIKENPPKITCL